MAPGNPTAPPRAWTAVELAERFGPLPLDRVRGDPAPGTAHERDLVAIHERENRLYELVDGVLIEKTVGAYESFLATRIAHLLIAFVEPRGLGVVLGADGMTRLAPGLVRIPDVSFLSWERLPDGAVPRTAVAEVSPDLAVEVLSPSNTAREMQTKLRDYLAASVRVVWHVDPRAAAVTVYEPRRPEVRLGAGDRLEGGEVLAGFGVEVDALFAPPPRRT